MSPYNISRSTISSFNLLEIFALLLEVVDGIFGNTLLGISEQYTYHEKLPVDVQNKQASQQHSEDWLHVGAEGEHFQLHC